jgi:selenocysteine lyase/cysteine desulfurase
MDVDWSALREEFPALRSWTFLNTATFGQMPRCAAEAVSRHFARRDQFACSDFLEWFDDLDGLRGLIARFVHCEPSDVAFVPNASTAFSLLLGGIDWRPGDEVVTLADEFPNHYYYPSNLRARGVRFVETCFERFYDAVSPRTRLAALSTVNYSTGLRPPLEEISAFLRARGVLLYIDGTQSVGALELDLSRVRPSMAAVHAYKWMLSPNGAGFMYVSPEVREWLEPSVVGWRSHKDWRNHDRLHHGAPEFKSEAEKYEGGMLTFAVQYAMGAVIGMMLEIGPERIQQRVLELAAQTREALRRRGAVLLSDLYPHHDSPIIAARFEGRDASELARQLQARRVLVAARHGNLRVSPHFYNSEHDIQALDQCLFEICR